jgi:hypothetical protein
MSMTAILAAVIKDATASPSGGLEGGRSYELALPTGVHFRRWLPHAINVSKVGGLDCGGHSWGFPVWVGEIDAEELLVAHGLPGRHGCCHEGIVGGSQRGRLSIHRKPEGILRKQYEELAATEVQQSTRWRSVACLFFSVSSLAIASLQAPVSR